MFWTHQEGTEHGDGGQEVPDVVIVEEGEQDTLTVVLTRLGWSFLETQIDQHHCAQVTLGLLHYHNNHNHDYEWAI